MRTKTLELVYKAFEATNPMLTDDMLLKNTPDQKISEHLDSIGLITLIAELNDILLDANIENVSLEELTSTSTHLKCVDNLANFLQSQLNS